MRVLIVALTYQLPIFLSVMNPELNVCAIVTDEPKPAKEITEKYDQADVPIIPYWHLKECIESYQFDYVINVSDFGSIFTMMTEELQDYGVPSDKIVAILGLLQPNHVDALTKLMDRYKQDVEKFKIFATGSSTPQAAIDIDKFELPTINCAHAAQDLYYDFKIAQELIDSGGGGRLRYALIGLMPYTFDYDVSRTVANSWLMLQWFLYFRDLHNFCMSVEDYSSLFSKKFLDGGYVKPSETPIDLNNVYSDKTANRIIAEGRISTRKAAEKWLKKRYPKTIEEYKKILDDYLTLCDGNGIKPILFLPPRTAAYVEVFDNNFLNEFYANLIEIMSRHPTAVFFDCWRVPNLPDDDFSDPIHMNVMGGAKFSYVLNQFVMQFERK